MDTHNSESMHQEIDNDDTWKRVGDISNEAKWNSNHLIDVGTHENKDTIDEDNSDGHYKGRNQGCKGT